MIGAQQYFKKQKKNHLYKPLPNITLDYSLDFGPRLILLFYIHADTPLIAMICVFFRPHSKFYRYIYKL